MSRKGLHIVSAAALLLFSFGGCGNPFGKAGKVSRIDPVFKPGYAVKPPHIASVFPATANVQGGAVISIFGTDFVSGATVTFGDKACGTVRFVSSTQLTCVAPPNVAGRVDVTVTHPDHQSAILSSAFAYVGSANPIAGFAATSGGGISKGGGLRLQGSVGITGNPILQTGAGFGAKTGLQGALNKSAQ